MKLHNGENSSLRKDSRSIKEGLPAVLGNKRTLAKYLREQVNVSLFFLDFSEIRILIIKIYICIIKVKNEYRHDD